MDRIASSPRNGWDSAERAVDSAARPSVLMELWCTKLVIFAHLLLWEITFLSGFGYVSFKLSDSAPQ